MNARAFLVAALLLVAAACAVTSPEESDAARRGADDAARDLARGRARRALIGLVPDDRSALDPATGLVGFSAGCCRTPARVAYCDAYNDAVRAAPGLSSRTLAAKATTRTAVEALLAGGGVEIRRGAPVEIGPGGRFRLEVAPGAGRDAVALWTTDATTGERSELRYLGEDRARIVVADGGTTLCLRDDVVRAYATFDLPSAQFLEVFPDPPRER